MSRSPPARCLFRSHIPASGPTCITPRCCAAASRAHAATTAAATAWRVEALLADTEGIGVKRRKLWMRGCRMQAKWARSARRAQASWQAHTSLSEALLRDLVALHDRAFWRVLPACAYGTKGVNIPGRQAHWKAGVIGTHRLEVARAPSASQGLEGQEASIGGGVEAKCAAPVFSPLDTTSEAMFARSIRYFTPFSVAPVAYTSFSAASSMPEDKERMWSARQLGARGRVTRAVEDGLCIARARCTVVMRVLATKSCRWAIPCPRR